MHIPSPFNREEPLVSETATEQTAPATEDRPIVGYDPRTGAPQYDPTASEIDGKNEVEVASYNPQTGEPIYRKRLSVKGQFEYFVNNVGTVYADSEGDALAKVFDVYEISVPISDIRICGVNSHKKDN